MDAGMFKAAIDGNDGFFDEAGGVNLNLTQLTEGGNSVLHVAAISGKVQIARRILAIDSQPSLLCEKNRKGGAKKELLEMENLEKNTALHEAIKNDHYDIMQLLINEDRGLTSLTNNAGESPLFLAVDRGFYDIAIHILEAVPECSNVGRKSMNVLHAAVIRTQRKEKAAWQTIYHFLRAILKLSNSENEQATKCGMTILDFMGKLLEACPSAIVEADDFGWIPLHYAAHFGNEKFVDLFLKKNMSLVYIKDKAGMSALHISAKEGHADVTRTLISVCPDSCELLDNRGRTALHLAAESGRSKVVKVFLQTLASEDLINQQDEKGNTPFHLAAMKRHYELLMMLAKDRRIDWMAVNKEGMSTVDIIQSDKRPKSGKKTKIMSKLNRDDIGLSLERIVDRQTTEVQTLDTEGHGQLIQETDRNESAAAEVRTGMDAANGNAEQNEEKETPEAIRKMADVNLLVSTIIASVTYAAVIQMPGGYDNNGKAILSTKKDFIRFMSFNALAFLFSLVSMVVQFCVGHINVRGNFVPLYAALCLTLTECSIIYCAAAFFCAISATWTEGLTVLFTRDKKRRTSSFPPNFDATSTALMIPSIFFVTVFFIFNKKYLVPILPYISGLLQQV
ncbi:ankyrin repeat-containing protein At5g02620-like isoform X3 [Quercus robur]|uniref:ankyrin repeat-containing protein At5g02620-like isoform X3 n=1 Tax=Quercus robur TaxID=38942 RepID=UPI0021630B91|nr:ankyrin repeat-containing protein At5g02620-like isoform X3 [Quercus robur]